MLNYFTTDKLYDDVDIQIKMNNETVIFDKHYPAGTEHRVLTEDINKINEKIQTGFKLYDIETEGKLRDCLNWYREENNLEPKKGSLCFNIDKDGNYDLTYVDIDGGKADISVNIKEFNISADIMLDEGFEARTKLYQAQTMPELLAYIYSNNNESLAEYIDTKMVCDVQLVDAYEDFIQNKDKSESIEIE